MASAQMSGGFQNASGFSSCFLFIDDLDKSIDDESDFEILRRCMEEAKNKRIFVIATVTNIYGIPESLREINGFDRVIEIVNPEITDTEKIVKHYLGKRPYNPCLYVSDVAGFLHNIPIAEIENIINDAAMYAVYENRCQVEMKDMYDRHMATKIGLKESTVASYLDTYDRYVRDGEILSYGIDKNPFAKNVMDALNKAVEITSDCPYRRTFHSD